MPKPASTDAYLAALDPRRRAALERLRRTIRAAAPGAVECISYDMPAFRIDGKALVYFAAMAEHLSFFPGSSTVVSAFARELAGYSTSKGTIRFSADEPLPAGLVRKIVAYRLAEIAGRKPGSAGARARRARPSAASR